MEKQRWEESERRKEEERRSEKRKSQKKEDAGARKGKTLRFSSDLWFRESKSRLAKATGAEPSGQMRDEKLHAVVAQSTFRSQNVQNTSTPEHFWKLRCGKRARRYGAKVREAHFEVNTCKTHQVRSTFGR